MTYSEFLATLETMSRRNWIIGNVGKHLVLSAPSPGPAIHPICGVCAFKHPETHAEHAHQGDIVRACAESLDMSDELARGLDSAILNIGSPQVRDQIIAAFVIPAASGGG